MSVAKPLLVLAVTAVWAGCASASGTQTAFELAQPASTVSAPGEVEDAGTLVVIVVDEANLPIAGAVVALMELSLQATTDDAGAVTFTNLPGGPYQVAATQIGYTSAVKGVTVEPGSVINSIVSLSQVAADVPYHETYGPLRGHFDCRAAIRLTSTESWTGNCGSVCASAIDGCVTPGAAVFTNDNAALQFELTSPKLASVVGDMQWTQSSFATSTALRFAFSHEGRNSMHWWCAAEGPSPQWFRYEVDAASACKNVGTFPDPAQPDPSLVLRMYANTPFGTESSPTFVTFQQNFEMLATLFYGERAPETYSGFADQ